LIIYWLYIDYIQTGGKREVDERWSKHGANIQQIWRNRIEL